MQPDLKMCSPFLEFGGFEYLRTCANSSRALAKRNVQKVRMRRAACTVKFTSASSETAAMVRYQLWLPTAKVIDRLTAIPALLTLRATAAKCASITALAGTPRGHSFLAH